MKITGQMKALMTLGMSSMALLLAAGCGGVEQTTDAPAKSPGISSTPEAAKEATDGENPDELIVPMTAPLSGTSASSASAPANGRSGEVAAEDRTAGVAADEKADKLESINEEILGQESSAAKADHPAVESSLGIVAMPEARWARGDWEKETESRFDGPKRIGDREGAEALGESEANRQSAGQQEGAQQQGAQQQNQPAIVKGRRQTLSRRGGEAGGDSPDDRYVRSVELLPGEELWVIAKSDEPRARQTDPETPGCGALMAQVPGETVQVPVPLKHTAVSGNIDGYIATVDVTQQFHNPYSSKIEAVYVFPLPQNAAVNEFVMTVGDRRIRGIIREREKAEQIYAQARAQGHVASLLTQERPNIFTQKVANIEPGRQIDINIRYFNTLRYEDGEYEFVFPMVVGPRFNPSVATDGVGAVARGHHNVSGQSTEVQYLAPNERSGHEVSLSLKINAGVQVEGIRSINHAIEQQEASTCERHIKLAANDTIPNKDFVLRYRVAGEQIKTALLTHKDDHGQYFTMMIYPPAELASVQRSPMEMVYVLDCSGSMNGKPIEQAKAAIEYSLQQLTPRDTFQIIQFSNNSSRLGKEPVLATPENIQKGIQYVQSFSGSGGTQMIEGIKAALDFPHDEGRFRLVSFMTDGFIGNEQQILQTLCEKLGASRIFSFGVGSSPNRYLMDRMAILGQGAVTYLSLNDNAVDIMDRFQQRISHPAMTDLTIEFGDMEVTDVYPQRIPDLIVGRPIIVTGRFVGQPSAVEVSGRIDMMPASFIVNVDEQTTVEKHPSIAAVWARMKIADLMMGGVQQPDQADNIKHLVTETALNHNLMSRFTAFVAVDSLTVTEGDFGTTVSVPVQVPEGVKYETTVTN